MQQMSEKKEELCHCSSATSLRSGSSASECKRTTFSYADTLSLKFGASQRWADMDSDDEECTPTTLSSADTLSLKFGASQRWADMDSDDEECAQTACSSLDTLSLKFRSSQRWADTDAYDEEIDEAFLLHFQNGLAPEAEDSTSDDCGAAPEMDEVPDRAASSLKVDHISLCNPSEVLPGPTTAWQTKMPHVGQPYLQSPQLFDEQGTNQTMPPAQTWTMAVAPPPPSPWQGNLPEYASAGSIGHPFTCNAPCRFNSGIRGCKDAAACTHCHLCTWSRAAKRDRDHRVHVLSMATYTDGRLGR